jgi:uncharacterized membrane protein
MDPRKNAGNKGAPREGTALRLPNDVSRTRLEFLFDGVFAIAMTLLVLELKVPEIEDPRSARELLAALSHHGPGFFSFLLSFSVLGILWNNHQRQYRYIVRVTKGIFAANLVLMVTAASFPFCAALYGRYWRNPFSIVFYLACLFIHILASTLQWTLARRAGVLNPELDPALSKKIHARGIRASLVLGTMTVAYLALGFSNL